MQGADKGALSSLTFSALLSLGVLLYLVYWVSVFIYRITFHPLAKFPGPRLAGATFWYEFYYDIYPHDGKYLWKIKALHEQYGSIIRMNPYYIHIDDPDYFDEIYAVGKRRDKSLFFNPGAGTSHPMSGSMFLALDHDLHKQRRGAVASLFSRNAIRNLQPVVDERVNYAMNKLHQEYVNGTVVNLSDLNAGLTLDVISTYCFGDKLNSLEGAADGKTWRAMLTEGATGNNFGRHFPWFVNTVATLSPDVQKKLAPKQAPFILWAQSMKPVIKNILDGKRNASNEHQTIFHEIRDSNLPDAEKDPQRLMGEAFVFIGAGTETTARTLSVLHFYLAKDFAARERLFQELKQVMPTVDSPITLEQAQKLPYFSACVNEGLRLAHGVVSAGPRIAPLEDLQYKGWTIPRGTPVMQSQYLMHTNPSIWPEPFKFIPQRWIDNPKLSKYFAPFSRGTRNCLGQNLAWAELFTMTARLFRRYQIELYETYEERDVITRYDYIMGMVDKTSPGIRAKIIGENKE